MQTNEDRYRELVKARKNPHLVAYLYQDGQRVGVVVATGPNNIGWSVCCPRDEFGRWFGQYKALKRAEAMAELPTRPGRPELVADAVARMEERAAKYFKQPVAFAS